MAIGRTLSVVRSSVFAAFGALVLFADRISIWFRIALALVMFAQTASPLIVINTDSRERRPSRMLLARLVMWTMAGVFAGVGLIEVGGWGGYVFTYGVFGFAWALGWSCYRIAKQIRRDASGESAK